MAVVGFALSMLTIGMLAGTNVKQAERIETVRYVTETQYVTVAKPARMVYVERIVEVETIVEVAVPSEPIVQAIPVPPLTVLPEPAIVPAEPPLIEPPVVVAAVCEHRGKGVGKQVGVCRKQGFP